MRGAWRITICGLATIAVAAVPVAGAQAATPALKAMVAPSTAHAGDVVALKLTVHNAAPRAAKHVAVVVTLVPADGSAARRVHATSIASVRPRAQTTARVAATIPATGAPASFTLHVCIGRRCLDTHPITLLAGDAYDRITSALAAHTLSIGKAALYEMQAAAGSPDVPAAYRNTAPGGPDTPGEIALENWRNLSANDRAALVPYFLPPRYAQSAWAPTHHTAHKRASTAVSATLADASAPDVIPTVVDFLNCRRRSNVPGGDWSVSASSGDVVIHSQDKGDFGLVSYLAGQVPKISTTLVATDHFPAPASDASCDPQDDGRLDVYLVPKTELATAGGVAMPLGCGVNSPGYILIRDDMPAEQTALTLAHEFFHIEQFAAGVACDPPKAWVEGGATWAEQEVYGKDPLAPQNWSVRPTQAMTSLSYSAWPFWYWLRHQYGADKIATLFSTLRSAGFDQAVRQAPGVNFVDAFRDFAMYLWNQSPIGDGGDFPAQSFAQWDGYTARPDPPSPVLTLGGATGGPTPDTYRTTVTVPPLSVAYVEFRVPTGSVKEITVDNGFADRSQVGVDLYAVTSQPPQRINMTTLGEKTFCEDTPGEDIGRGVIAVSNASTTASTASVDVVVGSRCKPSLEFDGTWKCDAVCGGAGTSQDWDWTGSANLAIDPESPATAPLYTIVNGAVAVNVHGINPNGCTFSGSTNVPLNQGHDAITLSLSDQPPAYQFSVILYNEPITITYAGCTPIPDPTTLPVESVPFGQTTAPLARDPSAVTLEHTQDTPEAPGQAATHQHWRIGL